MNSTENKVQRGLSKLKQKMSNEVNWDDKSLEVWKRAAEDKQAFYCSTLGSKDWEEYSRGEELYLKLKVGFSLYGPPQCTGEENNEQNLQLFLSEPEKRKSIELLVGLIEKEWTKEKLRLSFIYLIAWVEGNGYTEFPVVRVLRGQDDQGEDLVCYIDALGRVYRDWNDFLKNNNYPKCIYCFPKDGCYKTDDEGRQFLEFDRSPKSRLLKKLGKNLDSASNVAGIGSAAVLVAGVFLPIAAPIVAGAAATGLTTSLWSTWRTLSEMVDRKEHCQTLSLMDPEGRSCWINLAAGILGAASSGAIQYSQLLARNGRVVSRLVDLSSIGVTSLSVLNHIVTLIQSSKFANCSELVLSVLFFCHCSISLRTAKEILFDIEQKINLTADVHLTPEQQAVFADLIMESKRVGLIEGDNRIVKTLKIINNKDSFIKEFGDGKG